MVAFNPLKRSVHIERQQAKVTGSVLTVSFGCLPRERNDHCPCHLTNVAADGRDKVVGLCMFGVESPSAELGR